MKTIFNEVIFWLAILAVLGILVTLFGVLERLS